MTSSKESFLTTLRKVAHERRAMSEEVLLKAMHDAAQENQLAALVTLYGSLSGELKQLIPHPDEIDFDSGRSDGDP